MKFTSKRLISFMLVLAFALAMLPMAAFATSLETLYLVPNANWLIDGARFAAVLATNGWSAQVWVDAIDSDGDGVYEVAVPQDGNDYTIAIFCRMNPGTTDNNWNNKWNQTSDLTIPTNGDNCYTVAGGSWDNGNGTWSYFTSGSEVEPEPTPALTIDSITAVGAGSGNFLYGIEWNPAASVNNAYDSEETPGVYTVSYNGIAAGSYEFKFAANGAWDISWGTGAEMVSGEVYDAYLGGNNSILVVTENNSYVTLTLDLTNIDAAGNGAKMSVEVEAPATSDVVTTAPESLSLGSNYYATAIGDSSYISSTFVATEDGTLSIAPSYMNCYESYTGEWSELPAAYIPMQFGRMNALFVNGEQIWLPFQMDVAAGDVIEVGFQSMMGAGVELLIDLAMVEPEVEYTYYVAGDAELCGDNWNPASNEMYLDYETGLWYNLFVVSSGTYEFKITTGSWDTPSYGDANGNNYSFTAKNASYVYIYFNAETTEISVELIEFGSYFMKVQLNADASMDDETVDMRVITYVENLMYSNVEVDITINGQTATVNCDTVYTAIKSNGATLTCEDIFGCEGYLVTYTIEDIPAAYFNSDIDLHTFFYPIEGNPIDTEIWSTGYRTIVLADLMG